MTILLRDLIDDYIRSLDDTDLENIVSKRKSIIEAIILEYGRLLTYLECDTLMEESGEFDLLKKSSNREKMLQVASLRLYLVESAKLKRSTK